MKQKAEQQTDVPSEYALERTGGFITIGVPGESLRTRSY